LLGARVLPPSPHLGALWEKMVNKYAAIVYIRLNASMIKPKKKLEFILRYRPLHIWPRILSDGSMGDRFKNRQQDNKSIQVNSEV